MPYGILKADTLTYYTASGDISIPVSGIAATVSGTIAVPSGTAAAPSISYIGDPDTGFYSPGANQVAIATSGTGRLFVDGSGIVRQGVTAIESGLIPIGIVTSTSTAQGANFLAIKSADSSVGASVHLSRSRGTAGAPTVLQANDTVGAITFNAHNGTNYVNVANYLCVAQEISGGLYSSAHTFGTSVSGGALTERVRIAPDGKVGIGTNAPGATLQVIATSGSTAHQVNTSGGGIFTTIFDNSTAYQLAFTGVTNAITAYAVGTQSTIPFSILTSNTERVNVSSSGVVTVKNGAVAEIGTLTDGATITPDFAANCNFTVTISGNRTIANPTNITAGQAGSVFIVQGSGSNTLGWGSYWDFPSGTAPTLSTASGAVDRVDYIVRTATSIHTVFTANYS